MKMGEVERRTGLKAGMIRFYEHEGVSTPAERTQFKGYRSFTEKHVRELRFIAQMASLGFKIEEIKRLKALEARIDPESVAARNEILAKRIAVLDKEIADRQRTKETVLSLMR